jgi:SAM-dependent methyltransferase
MPLYRHRIYPAIVKTLGDPEPIREVRRQLVPQAAGTVLEIGVGPGVNFAHYDTSRVKKLYALEPNPGMVRYAEHQRLETRLDATFIDLPGERIPLEDESVDTVVSTFTLCTIPGVVEALEGVRRVLKPGGRLLFFEHGLAPDARRRRWQRWSEPVTRFIFEGCHVTRDIPSLIETSGFRIDDLQTGYLAPFPKSWTYCFWGAAVPTTASGPPVGSKWMAVGHEAESRSSSNVRSRWETPG